MFIGIVVSSQSSIILMPPRADGRVAEVRPNRQRTGPAFDIETIAPVSAAKAVIRDDGARTREVGRETRRAELFNAPARRHAPSTALVTDGEDTFFDRRRLATSGFMTQHIAQELLPEKDGPERFRTSAIAYMTARESTVIVTAADTHLDIQI